MSDEHIHWLTDLAIRRLRNKSGQGFTYDDEDIRVLLTATASLDGLELYEAAAALAHFVAFLGKHGGAKAASTLLTDVLRIFANRLASITDVELLRERAEALNRLSDDGASTRRTAMNPPARTGASLRRG